MTSHNKTRPFNMQKIKDLFIPHSHPFDSNKEQETKPANNKNTLKQEEKRKSEF